MGHGHNLACHSHIVIKNLNHNDKIYPSPRDNDVQLNIKDVVRHF